MSLLERKESLLTRQIKDTKRSSQSKSSSHSNSSLPTSLLIASLPRSLHHRTTASKSSDHNPNRPPNPSCQSSTRIIITMSNIRGRCRRRCRCSSRNRNRNSSKTTITSLESCGKWHRHDLWWLCCRIIALCATTNARKLTFCKIRSKQWANYL